MTDVRLTATNPDDASVVPVACNEKGELKLEEPIAFDGDLDGDLSISGRASIGADNFVTPLYVKGENATVSKVESTNVQCLQQLTNSSTDLFYVGTSGDNWNVQTAGNQRMSVTKSGRVGIGEPAPKAKLDVAGDLKVNAKAGFTADGYLWCTDSRGHTHILDFVSNGLATWAEYTPPTRIEEAQEKLEEVLEKEGDDDSPAA
tara:strand:- start:3178 stop:3786 length:609 start_codon:yes stop_codon:yes gene_type:complete